ncbi:hypothetical protein [Hugenholtzia roseola]|uniref:hypothetical protein n=1 Tax=Hugenholtzia roseola TaxID=1002 RepID=UPI000400E8DC|nr:hypothetical protein [Hugenholtzia roseola]
MLKKIHAFQLFALLMLATFGLSSCGDTTEDIVPAPIIILNPESVTVDVGQTASANYSVTTQGTLNQIQIQKEGVTLQTISSFTSTGSHEGRLDYLTTNDDAGKTIVFTLIATDTEGTSGRADFTVVVNEAPTPTLVRTYTLGAQGSAQGSFASAGSDQVFSIAQAKQNAANIDFAYLFGTIQGAVVGSPRDNSVDFIYGTNSNFTENGVHTWSQRNDTRFKLTALTTNDFNGITNGRQLETSYNAGTQPDNDGASEGSSSRTALEVNKVYAFRTQAGKFGLILVNRIQEGANGQAALTIKVQE